MLHRERRHPHTGETTDFHAPHTRGVHNHLAGNVAPVGVHRRDPPALNGDAVDPGVFDDLGATHFGALRDGLRDAGRVDVAIGRQKRRRQNILGGHQREQR